MNIWIDILHTPQLNFYKPLISRLANEGHCVYVTVVNRGKLAKIAKKEVGMISNVFLSVIGRHRMNKLSVLFEANIIRLFQLYFWANSKNIDIILSNGYLAAMVGYYKKIDSFSFDDDPDTFDYFLKMKYNKKLFYCIYSQRNDASNNSKIQYLPVLKEWAYLNSNEFVPSQSILNSYNLEPKKYLFIREVSVGTLNYSKQKSGAVYSIKHLIPKDIKVVFSLETKSNIKQYPNDWILLKEPVKDIYSLIYYSRGLVSSGDSMAREAALLGVPSYYLGVRDQMPANIAASKIADFNNTSCDFRAWINKLKGNVIFAENQQVSIRKQISDSFISINEFMYNTIFNIQDDK